MTRAEDYPDTLAWLDAYLNALVPITQWCRVITQTQVAELIEPDRSPELRGLAGAWVGAILAECSAQAPSGVNLREVPGNAAVSTATFAAGRSIALRGQLSDLREIANRHDEVSIALRAEQRPLSAQKLVPLWASIVRDPGAAPTVGSVDAFGRLFELASVENGKRESAEVAQALVEQAASAFQAPELLACSRGTQSDRVKALDRFAQGLLSEPAVPTNDALLGLAASLVEPGAAVLPELLRRFSVRFPVAPIWMGAFAGAMSPLRVMSDYQGLGRLILKALLASRDLQARPSSDVSYDELARWIGGSTQHPKIPVRGMAARSVVVELTFGVACAFPFGRQEQPRDDAPVTRERSKQPVASNSAATDPLSALVKRVEQLESLVSKLTSGEPQLDLPAPDVSSRRASPKTKWKK